MEVSPTELSEGCTFIEDHCGTALYSLRAGFGADASMRTGTSEIPIGNSGCPAFTVSDKNHTHIRPL